MDEKWVLIEIDGDEILRCHSCYEGIHDQNVHLHLNVDDEVDEVMCVSCCKKYGGET